VVGRRPTGANGREAGEPFAGERKEEVGESTKVTDLLYEVGGKARVRAG
jgi:hypothetical protein